MRPANTVIVSTSVLNSAYQPGRNTSSRRSLLDGQVGDADALDLRLSCHHPSSVAFSRRLSAISIPLATLNQC